MSNQDQNKLKENLHNSDSKMRHFGSWIKLRQKHKSKSIRYLEIQVINEGFRYD